MVCGQEKELFTQSTELSTEPVVIPVENLGEVGKIVRDIALE